MIKSINRFSSAEEGTDAERTVQKKEPGSNLFPGGASRLYAGYHAQAVDAPDGNYPAAGGIHCVRIDRQPGEHNEDQGHGG